MNVEYTGRHYEVTPANRKEVEAGLTKIRKILRDRFEAKVVLAVEKRRHKAEITINSRVGPLVGLAQARDMNLAIGEALEHLEKQALKNKTRIITRKRHGHKQQEVERRSQARAGRRSRRGSGRFVFVIRLDGGAQVSCGRQVNRSPSSSARTRRWRCVP